MITYITGGDLLASTCHTLVNTVNCQGIMGKGLALQFKQQFPKCVPAYEERCDMGLLKPGQIKASREYLPEHLIIHAATKDRWYWDSRIEWVQNIMHSIAWEFGPAQMGSIALSPLGCGNGRLSWDAVGPIMAKYLSVLPQDARIEIYIKAGMKEYH